VQTLLIVRPPDIVPARENMDLKIIVPCTDSVLKTRRLTLRYPRLDDAPAIYSAVSSPRFPDLVPLKEMSAVGEIEAWLRSLQESWADGRGFSWMLEDRDSGGVVGQVTLSAVGDDVWAMAFWTHPDCWGQGYATEGAGRLLAFGFTELGAEEIWAGAGKWNLGSIRVLEKLGMEYTGQNPKGYYSWGRPIATKEYAISRQRWRQSARE
jgi:ribosomal-protein-alanine N-acetyltransferase